MWLIGEGGSRAGHEDDVESEEAKDEMDVGNDPASAGRARKVGR